MSLQNKPGKKLRTLDIRAMKGGTPITVLTAYTAPIAKILDPLVECILVGDSLAMTIYGEDSTLGVDLETMIRHGRAVARAARQACVVVDMPFGSYQESPAQAFANAARVLSETGCDAVKIEGGVEMADTIRFLVERGVPVMGHIGLTPQSVNTLGGFRTQGREDGARDRLLADAEAMNTAGCFAVVIEGVVEEIARDLHEMLEAPSIGIGASAVCDGQVLVIDDVIGMFEAFQPKFVKRFAEISPQIRSAVEAYVEEVRARKFPAQEHIFKNH